MNWKPNHVYFREFPDGDWEIGVCESRPYGSLMDVDSFAYYSEWDSGRYPWIEIGDL